MLLTKNNKTFLIPLDRIINELENYCNSHHFIGYDPYDGLQSKLFRSIPWIRNNRLCRLAWIQFHKRSPFNFRKCIGIKALPNAKTFAIFLMVYCKWHKYQADDKILDKIKYLVKEIIQLKQHGYQGACWGYPFDWESKSFFLKANTPTSVCTAFVVTALLDAYEILKDDELLRLCFSSADFFLKDLHRREYEKGYFSISYSPKDYSEVYNASYLVAATLSRLNKYQNNDTWKSSAKKLIEFGANKQLSDGLWNYGSAPHHQWADGFHTGYILVSLAQYITNTGDTNQQPVLEKGFDCFLKSFVEANGTVRYYPEKTYPIDAHNMAQAIISLTTLVKSKKEYDIAENILWKSIHHLYDERGYFYFRSYSNYKIKIPYMRWSQAWMLLALITFKSNLNNENLV